VVCALQLAAPRAVRDPSRCSFSRRRRRPPAPLFPYTTLFRSFHGEDADAQLPVHLRVDHAPYALDPELDLLRRRRLLVQRARRADRKSTRLNSSHVSISYAVFCLKKKTPPPPTPTTGRWQESA